MKGNMKPQKWIREGLSKKMSVILPSLFLFALFGLIIGLSGTIKAARARMTVEKREVIAKEKPTANVILLDVRPTAMLDQINLPGVIEPWEELSVLATHSSPPSVPSDCLPASLVPRATSKRQVNEYVRIYEFQSAS